MTADLSRVREAHEETFGEHPVVVASAPGRVNLLGEHTDYNQGLVLPVAIDRRVAVAASPASGGVIRVHALDAGSRDEFRPDSMRRARAGDWRNYVRGVVWALAESGCDIDGADVTIAGDVPQGAGLSSSAALSVAAVGAVAAAAGIQLEPRRAALVAHQSENAFVGVHTGIMDQFAAALGVEGHALFIDCRSEEVQAVPLDDRIAVVVVDSGVQRRLSDTPYNQRRKECASAAQMLGFASLRDAASADLEGGEYEHEQLLVRRARHVVGENGRVLAGVEALRAGDAGVFGRLMYESHESLRDDFEVSCAELDLLVELARRAGGVLGARLTGAGFGGSTVNLVRREAVSAFESEVVAAYAAKTGRDVGHYVCRAASGLVVEGA